MGVNVAAHTCHILRSAPPPVFMAMDRLPVIDFIAGCFSNIQPMFCLFVCFFHKKFEIECFPPIPRHNSGIPYHSTVLGLGSQLELGLEIRD